MGRLTTFGDAVDAGRRLDGPMVAIGNFDGLHVGHVEVLSRCRALARQQGAPTALLTFRPHPAEVLARREPPPRLLSDAQREEILEDLGFDALVIQRFDEQIAALPPRAFVEIILGEALGVHGVVVGAGFRFGAGRSGDVAQLARLAAERGAEVVAVPPVSVAGVVVSSSRIRFLVAAGEDEQAAALLGRPYVLEGTVISGDGRGRQLGFPTANVASPSRAIPGSGVHACVVGVGAETWPAVANVGVRPTFGGGAPVVEVHVLGEPGDLLGARLRVAFIRRLREERRFPGPRELVTQIARDVEAAQAVLAEAPIASWRGPGF